MNALWQNIFRNRRKTALPVRDIIRAVPLFEGLSARELQMVERILHDRQYRMGEPVFIQGDPGVGMYVIAEGTVEISDSHCPAPLAELQQGDFFGELSLMDDSPRSASAVARTECRLLCIFRPDLMDLINRYPRLGVNILLRLAGTIGERLRKTNECLAALPGQEDAGRTAHD